MIFFLYFLPLHGEKKERTRRHSTRLRPIYHRNKTSTFVAVKLLFRAFSFTLSCLFNQASLRFRRGAAEGSQGAGGCSLREPEGRHAADWGRGAA